MAKNRAGAGTNDQDVDADEGGAPYPVFCSYCGVLTRRSAVRNMSGMCRPCFDRVWNDYVRRHPEGARNDLKTTGQE